MHDEVHEGEEEKQAAFSPSVSSGGEGRNDLPVHLQVLP